MTTGLKIYDLFISHAWRNSDDYDRLVDILNAAPRFEWRNYSSPRHDPAKDPDTAAGRRALRIALDGQIRPVNCVLIISGMYAAYSFWIQAEINIAESYGKPIVGIRPWDQERLPQAVQDAANEMVGWNSDSIVSTVRRLSL